MTPFSALLQSSFVGIAGYYVGSVGEATSRRLVEIPDKHGMEL
jgi:hypothetical protein